MRGLPPKSRKAARLEGAGHDQKQRGFLRQLVLFEKSAITKTKPYEADFRV